MYVYKYTDISDGIVKYVGIVWSNHRELRKRIYEHSYYDDWCKDKKWKIEFLKEDVQSRTDAECLEAHYIAKYNTHKYYNIKKKNWGLCSFVNDTNKKWTEYTICKPEKRESNKKSRKETFQNRTKNIVFQIKVALNALDKCNEPNDDHIKIEQKFWINTIKNNIDHYNEILNEFNIPKQELELHTCFNKDEIEKLIYWSTR